MGTEETGEIQKQEIQKARSPEEELEISKGAESNKRRTLGGTEARPGWAAISK